MSHTSFKWCCAHIDLSEIVSIAHIGQGVLHSTIMRRSHAHLLLDLNLPLSPLVLLSDLCLLGFKQLQLLDVEVLIRNTGACLTSGQYCAFVRVQCNELTGTASEELQAKERDGPSYKDTGRSSL